MGNIITRRHVIGALAAGAAIPTFGFSHSAAAARENFVWLTWDHLVTDDYLDPYYDNSDANLITEFMADDREMLDRLHAGGDDPIGLVTPGLDKIVFYLDSDLLQPIDLDRVPNAKALYETFRTTPLGKKDGRTYGLPLYWGANPIVYRADMVGQDQEPDWTVMFEGGDGYDGKLAMPDSALEGIMAAAFYLGIARERIFHMDDADLAEVKKALMAQKKILRTYWTSIGEITTLLASGEVVSALSWLAPYHELQARNLDMGMAWPRAGVIGWCGALGIPAGVRGASLNTAHGLINYLLGPVYGEKLAIGGPFATSTSLARDRLSVAQQKNIFIDDLSRMDHLVWKQTPPRYDAWVKLWNEVRAG